MCIRECICESLPLAAVVVVAVAVVVVEVESGDEGGVSIVTGGRAHP